MTYYIVVSAIGRDRPGLVNQLAHTIHEYDGNIELQRSAKMAGEFATLMLFTLEAVDISEVIGALNRLSSDDLYVSAREAVGEAPEHAPETEVWELIVEGADEKGIIDDVTLFLYKNDINIETMDYDVISAPMSGIPLFEMRGTIAVPEDIDIHRFKRKLMKLEDMHTINIALRPGK